MKKIISSIYDLAVDTRSFWRLLLAAVFLTAGCLKLASGTQGLLLAGFQFLPSALVTVFENGLPWLEIGLGLLLISGYLKKVWLWAALGFIAGFIGTNIYSLASGNLYHCHCLGNAVNLTHGQSLVLDLLILVPAVLALWGEQAGLSTGRRNSAPYLFLKNKLLPRAGAIALCGVLLTASWPVSLTAADPAESTPDYPLMQPDLQDLENWQSYYLEAPVFGSSDSLLFGESLPDQPVYFSLLPLLDYTPTERDQRSVGNCWVWAGTGITEVALNTATGVSDRLSVQYLNSNFYHQGQAAGCGGVLNYYAGFYNGYSEFWYDPEDIEHIVVPWSNSGADYQDVSGVCAAPSEVVVATSPGYPLNDNIGVESIGTAGISQSAAVANIKSALLNNQAVSFSWYMPDTDSTAFGDTWNDFFDFWGNQDEDSVWTPNMISGLSWPDVGGHAVLCVGYDDRDDSWIMLNSWGTTAQRPNGLFRLTQDLDYSNIFGYGGSSFVTLQWQTLNNLFEVTAPGVTVSQAEPSGAENATLNATLTGLGGNESVTAYFEYGTDSAYGITTAAQTLSGPTVFSSPISGLSQGETYYYRAVVEGDNVTQTIYSPAAAFVMSTYTSGNPAITTLAATDVSQNSATLQADLTDLGTEGGAQVYFEYGETADLGSVSNTLEKTTTGQFSRTISGLTAGATYYYRAVAEGNTTAYGDNLTFTTLASPGVTTLEAENVGYFSATLVGELTSLGLADSVNVFFKWDTDTVYGQTTLIQEKNYTGLFSVEVSDLDPSTTYHFIAYAVDPEGDTQNGVATGADMTFTTLSIEVPEVSTSPATNVTSDGATLGGFLDQMGTAAAVLVGFEYGPTPDYGTVVESDTLLTEAAFSYTLTDLEPNTVYHYRAWAYGSHGIAEPGADLSFTTDTAAPEVTTLEATGTATTSATLNGRLDLVGADSADVYFEYAAEAYYLANGNSYNLTTGSRTLTETGSFNAGLSGLQPDTVYHYRAVATGDGTAYGADLTFTTSDSPEVTTLEASQVSYHSATLNGRLDSLGAAENVTVYFKYDTDTVYAYTTEGQIMDSAGTFSVELSGLQSNTTYHFQAWAENPLDETSSGSAQGVDLSFTTLATSAPEVASAAASSVSSNGAVLNGYLSTRGTADIVYVAFEYGLTSAYGSVTGSAALTASGEFNSAISGLEPNTTYHFRARATGHGTVYGDDLTFKTGTTAPEVSTLEPGTPASTSVTLNGRLDSLGADSVLVYFEYTPDSYYQTYGSYNQSTASQTYSLPGDYSAAVSGLEPGTLYHYRAAASGDGTVYGEDLTFTTQSRPEVTTLAASEVSYFSAILNANLTSLGLADSARVFFKYDTDTVYGYTTAVALQEVTGVFSATLTGLQPSTTYHFIAYAVNAEDNTESGIGTGVDLSFTTLAIEAPEVSTSPATEVTGNSVRLNGFLDLLGTASTVEVGFEYGFTSAYGSFTPVVTLNSAGAFSVELSDLAPNSTYHFRAVADGGLHGMAEPGADLSFTTDTVAPEVTTLEATGTATTSATLNGRLDLVGADSAEVYFEYAVEAYYLANGNSYNVTTGSRTLTEAGSFNTGLSGLQPDTVYHYRAVATGDGTAYGADLTFTTSASPEVTTLEASQVSYHSATLNGRLDSLGAAENVTVYFKYDTDTVYAYTTEGQIMDSAGTFSVELSGLQSNTTYHFQAWAENPLDETSSGSAQGVDLSFTTLATSAPEVASAAADSISSNGAVLNGYLSTRGTADIVYVAFEYGLTSAYGSVTGSAALTASGEFSRAISGLEPNTTYHFRARATGHGTVYGEDLTFKTGTTAPEVSTLEPGTPASTSVTLNGRLDSLGSDSVLVYFEYTPDSYYQTYGSYNQSTASQTYSLPGDYSAAVSGLEPGTLYHYRAAASGDGTVYGEDLTFTTQSRPEVTTLAASEVSYFSAVLNADLTSPGTAENVEVFFKYDTDTVYGYTSAVQTLNSAGTFSIELTGLQPSTTYHFKAYAVNADLYSEEGIAGGLDLIFTTLSTVTPDVSTAPAFNVSSSSAGLRGFLTSRGSAETVYVAFEYGTTTDYGHETDPAAVTSAGYFTATVNGLEPNTTYHFRAVADGGLHGSATPGADYTFTTLEALPVVTTGSHSQATTSTVTLYGNLVTPGSAAVSVQFEYATDAYYQSSGEAYDNLTGAQVMTAAGEFSAALSDLLPGTLYHYRAFATGSGTAYGEDRTFTTESRPEVSTEAASSVSYFSAVLNGRLVSPGLAETVEVFFKFDTDTVYGYTTPVQTLNAAGDFSYALSGLQPGTTYHFIAYAVNAADNTESGIGTGIDLSFTTLSTTEPEVSTSPAVSISSREATLKGFLDYRGTAETVAVSFEYGLTTAYGSNTIAQTISSAGAFSALIENLEPNTTYHYRALAGGGLHGTASPGADMTFTTDAAAPVVTTGSHSEASSTAVVLYGSLASPGSASVEVWFEYAPDSYYQSSGYENVTETQTLTAAGEFSAALEGLLPGTLYHYRAAASGAGTAQGEDMTFTTQSRPEVSTLAADNVSYFSATLKGDLTSTGTADNVTVFFKYDTSTNYGRTTESQIRNSAGQFSENLTGLQSGTTYHYIAYAVNTEDNTESGIATGVDVSFTTPGTSVPEVSTSPASGVTSSSAVLKGFLDYRGSADSVSVAFEYGPDSGYGSTTEAVVLTSAGAFSVTVSDLVPNTTYHFRAIASGGSHGTALPGSDLSFTTTSVPPVVSTLEASRISYETVTLNGNLVSTGYASRIAVAFEYGLTTEYGSSTEPVEMTTTGVFGAVITGLQPGATYHFRALADSDSQGEAVPGADLTFTTLEVSSPGVSTLEASAAGYDYAVLAARLDSTGTAPTVEVGFEYGPTTAYGQYIAVGTLLESGTFSVGIGDLTPGTQYHFRTVADGGIHGTAYGEDVSLSTLTPDPPQVSTVEATGLSYDNVVLNGDLGSLGTASTVNVYFEYGVTTQFGYRTTPQTLSESGVFSFNVTGLWPGNQYYYRAVANGGLHGTTRGDNLTFTLLEAEVPQVTTGTAEDISYSAAQLSGSLITLGTADSVVVSFEYGTSTEYGKYSTTRTLTAGEDFSLSVSGLTPGTTYHYRARAYGGKHGTAYGEDAQFTTSSGSVPLVVTRNATKVGSSKATLNGQLTDLGTAESVEVYFEYGLTTAYGQTTTAQTLTDNATFLAVVSGLVTGNSYHYRAVADGGIHGTTYGADTFFITRTPPVVSTLAATEIAAGGAQLNGRIESLGSAQMVYVFFEYGTTTDYGSTTLYQILTPSGTGEFSATLSGLEPGVSYHYRASVDAGVSGKASGSDLTFTTLSPPVLGTPTATNITTTSATLNGDIISMGSAEMVYVHFEYGLTTDYGYETNPQLMTAPGDFSDNITGLSPGTTYHFREVADGGASGTATGPDVTFTTLSYAPEVQTSPAGTPGTGACVLNGYLASMGTAETVNVYFEYGTTTAYGSETTVLVMDDTGLFNIEALDLAAGTLYHFRAAADGGTQGRDYGDDLTFTTATAAPTAVAGSITSVSTTSVTLNAILSSMGTATSVDVSLEYGPSTAYGSASAVTTLNATGRVSVNLTGLTAGTVYHYRVKADGGQHGTGYSQDYTFSTAAPNTTPPVVVTDSTSMVTINSARLEGDLTSLGTAANVSVAFEYGLTEAYGSLTPEQTLTAAGEFKTIISDLVPGTTYHFRTLADGADNGTAAGADMTFTTLVNPPEVSSSGATSVSLNSVTINGYLDSLGTAESVEVYFQYGITTNYDYAVFAETRTSPGPVSLDINDLNAGTTYFYRVAAYGGSHGKTYSSVASFTTSKAGTAPPTVNFNSEIATGSDNATLSGSLASLGTASTVKVSFQYGLTDSYGSTSTVISLTAAGSFSIPLSELTAGTTYHCRGIADGGDNGIIYGPDMTFTTTTVAPQVATRAITDYGSTTAVLNGSLISIGTAAEVEVWFEFGLTIAYDNQTTHQTLTAGGLFNFELAGLEPSTTYHYRALADAGRHGAATGGDLTFTTAPEGTAAPAVTTQAATSIKTNSAFLNGNLNSTGTADNVSVYFEYGTTSEYGLTTEVQIIAEAGSFKAYLSDLTRSTTYHFRAVALGGDNGTASGQDLTFTTRRTSYSGGGGGGGGSSSSKTTVTPTPTPTVPAEISGTAAVNFAQAISAAGLLASGVTLISEDDQVSLYIAPGTTVLNADGSLPSEITVNTRHPSTVLAVPAGYSVYLTAYNFEPSGITFDPAARMTFKVDPLDLPEEAAWQAGYFDTELKQWVILPDAVFDPETNTVSVPVAHFTVFALLIEQAVAAVESPTPTASPTPTTGQPSASPTPIPTGETTPTATISPQPRPTTPVTPVSTPEPEGSSLWLLVIVAVVAVLLGGAAYWWFYYRRRKPSKTEPAPANKLYEGTIKLTIKSPVEAAQLRALEEALRKNPDLRVESVGGSSEEGNIIIIFVDKQKPIYLIDVLNALPVVKEVNIENNRIVISL